MYSKALTALLVFYVCATAYLSNAMRIHTPTLSLNYQRPLGGDENAQPNLDFVQFLKSVLHKDTPEQFRRVRKSPVITAYYQLPSTSQTGDQVATNEVSDEQAWAPHDNYDTKRTDGRTQNYHRQGRTWARKESMVPLSGSTLERMFSIFSPTPAYEPSQPYPMMLLRTRTQNNPFLRHRR